MTELEIITMGRVSVDLYPEQLGVSLAEVKTFAKSLGGSATNVAVAAARLGHRSAVITKVGDDGFGAYVRAALKGFGVDPRWVSTDPDLRTPGFLRDLPSRRLPDTFLPATEGPGYQPPNRRSGPGGDSGGTALLDNGHGPLRRAQPEHHARCPRATLRRHHRLRPRLPPDVVGIEGGDRASLSRGSPARYRGGRQPGGGRGSGRHRRPVRGFEGAARTRSRARGCEAGPGGHARPDGGGRGRGAADRGGSRERARGGDAFGGALCHGLLSGWDLERMIRYANATGAIVASRLACADDMPTREEVEQLLEGSAGV